MLSKFCARMMVIPVGGELFFASATTATSIVSLKDTKPQHPGMLGLFFGQSEANN